MARLSLDGRPVRPLRRDASANRVRIIAVAEALLRERGDAVRMEDVSAAAGVGKGTLYRNYPDRAALAEAVLDGLARQVQARALAELAPGDGPALARLDRFVAMMFGFVADNLDLLCIAREGRRADPRLAPSHRWQRMVVVGLLAEAARRGECPAPDLGYLPEALLALIDPGLVRHQLADGRMRDDVLAGLRRAVAGAARGG